MNARTMIKQVLEGQSPRKVVEAREPGYGGGRTRNVSSAQLSQGDVLKGFNPSITNPELPDTGYKDWVVMDVKVSGDKTKVKIKYKSKIVTVDLGSRDSQLLKQ